MEIKLPFHNGDLRETVLELKKIETGTYILSISPTWPCYEKDGAGKTMHLSISLKFIDNQGNTFTLHEELWD